MSERKFLWWQELPMPEVVRFAKEVSDIAILPIGSIEQHGPHSPCGVAIPLSYDTHIALLVDIVKGATVSGYNKFIILSAHGQVSTTLVAVHKLGLEGIFTLSLHWYDFLRDDKDVLDDYMWHAEEAETSVGLYLFPQYVDMSKADKGGGQPLIDSRFIIAPGQQPRPGMMYHFEGTFARPEYKELDNGIIGDATKATREKGEIMVTRVVDHVVEIIEDIKARWPVGVKPPVQ